MIWEAFILAYLLLLVGYGLYRLLLRPYLSLQARKHSLLLLLGLALFLPLLLGQAQLPSWSTTVAASDYKAWNVVDIKDAELVDCYEEAQSSADMCTCELQQQSQKVHFDHHPLYNFFLATRGYALALLGLVVLVLGLRFLIALWGLWRLRRKAAPKPYPLGSIRYYRIPQEAWQLCAFSLGKHYLLWGAAWENCPDAERRAALQHEGQHLRQGDGYWRMVWALAHCLFFAHPLFYSLREEFLLLCELLADEKAAQEMPSKKAYAQLLLRVQQRQQQTGSALCLALGASHLRTRIVHLLEKSPPKKQSAAPRLFIATTLLFLVCWGSLPVLQAQEQELQHYALQKEQATAPCPSCND